MHTSRTLVPCALLLACLLATVAVPAKAPADTLASKQAQANRIQSQVDSLSERAAAAAELYNRAKIRCASISAKVRVVEKQVHKLEAHQEKLQTHLNTRAAELYRDGPFNFLNVLLGVRSLDDLEATARIMTTLNEQDAATVSQLKVAKAQAQAERQVLVAEQDQARQQQIAMGQRADEVRGELAQRERMLASVTAEIRALMARQIAQQAAADQARTMATLLRQRDPSQGGITLGGTPPSSKAAGAVYWAERELGKPYVWAASGPDSFDCSGLMCWAYDHVGITLNHYSGDQINEGKHVDRSDLQPGDLVFFGSPIHHVGMYVGGGCFIEAPYTGVTVRISELSSRGDFAGACRPAD
jgi:cell wall-associated NlpC family hydrolase